MEAQKIVKKLLDHEERINQLEDDRFAKPWQNRLFEILDEQSVILKRLDQERIATNSRIDRVETKLTDMKTDVSSLKEGMGKVKLKVDGLDKDMQKVKEVLKV